MVKRDEKWCRTQVTPAEALAFWKNWSETQWGMPDFSIMRQCIEARRAAAA